MKKTYFLLLAIILLFPFMIHAEEKWYAKTSDYMKISCFKSVNYASLQESDVLYEDGLYKLQNTFTIFLNTNINNIQGDRFFFCRNDQQCSNNYYISFKKACGQGFTSSGFVGINLTDGKKNADKYYIGTDYKYENGMYTMTEYEEYNLSEVIDSNHFSKKHEGKLMCLNYEKTCDMMYIISDYGSNGGGNTFSTYVKVDDYILVSNTYKKENNKFVLINPQKVYPAIDGNITGYSCYSREDSCDTLYKIQTGSYYDRHDGGRKLTYNALEITNKSEEKELKLKEEYNVAEFFKTSELSNTISTNPSVAEIKNGELVLYKVGNTDIIYEDDFTYKVLHLRVTEDALDNNPKTSTTSVFAIVLGLLLVTTLIVSKKKYFN